MENVVLPLSGAQGPLPAQIADALLRVLDAWMARLRAIAAKTGTLPDLKEELALLARLAEKPAKPASEPSAAAPEPARPAAPAPHVAEPQASSEEATWRVGTRQVLALMREVERLRELRLRIEERRREVDRTLERLTHPGILAQTAEARSQLLGVSRAAVADGEDASDIIASMEEGLKAISTLPVRTVIEPLRRSLRDRSRWCAWVHIRTIRNQAAAGPWRGTPNWGTA